MRAIRAILLLVVIAIFGAALVLRVPGAVISEMEVTSASIALPVEQNLRQGVNERVLHYVTVLGYDRNADTFAIYDSWHPQGSDGLTLDNNGTQPGNRELLRDDLLDFWRGGGVGPFYRWYGIAVVPSQAP